MTVAVPIIDLEPFRDGTDREAVVETVAQACRQTGFLIVTGHGVPAETIDATVDAMTTFFGRPLDQKARHTHPERDSGYHEFANMALGQSQGDDVPPDLREEIRVSRLDVLDPHSPVWGGERPDADLRAAVSDYYVAMDDLADTIMRVFALALAKPEDHFRQFVNRHNSNLGLYHYPPMTAPPLPGQLRGSAHTDFGSLTILYASPSVDGLQVWNGEAWEGAPVVPGSFVVNIGDLTQRWTNDLWRSTLHRVVNPVAGEWDKARYSIAFFHQPNHDAMISSLDASGAALYAPITSGEHFAEKIAAMEVSR